MNAEEKLLEIINHYGLNHQMRKLNEEVFELTEACLCFSDEDDLFTVDDIAEELADVLVIWSQIALHYEVDAEEINRLTELKIDRQLKRMEEE